MQLQSKTSGSDTQPLWQWGVVAFCAVLSVVPRLFYLKVPFERDEGVYAYIADAVSRGGVPYLDAFDNKSPGVYYLYNLSFKLFGHELHAPRVLAALFVLAACLLAYRLVYRLTASFPAGLVAIGFLGAATAAPVYTGFNSNTEIFTVPFILGALLLLVVDTPSPRRYLGAGLLFGCALMIKQSVLPIAVLAFAGSIFRSWRTPLKLATSTALYALGGAVPFLIFAACFLKAGAFAQFWSGFLLFNIGYASIQSEHLGWPRLAAAMSGFLRQDGITWLAGSAGMVIFLAKSRRSGRWPVAAALTGAALSVSMGGYYFSHYFLFIVPLLAVGAGLGIGSSAAGAAGKNFVIGGTFLLIIALLVQSPYFTMTPEEILKAGYGSGLFAQTALIGNDLRSRVSGERTAYTVGAEPEILWYAGLIAPTRFFYSHTLMVPAKDTTAFRKEALAAIGRAKPHYLVVVRNPDAHFPFAPQPEQFYDPLRTMFARYQLVALNLMYDPKVYSASEAKMDKALLGRPDAILVFEREGSSPADESLQFATLEKR